MCRGVKERSTGGTCVGEIFDAFLCIRRVRETGESIVLWVQFLGWVRDVYVRDWL